MAITTNKDTNMLNAALRKAYKPAGAQPASLGLSTSSSPLRQQPHAADVVSSASNPIVIDTTPAYHSVTTLEYRDSSAAATSTSSHHHPHDEKRLPEPSQSSAEESSSSSRTKSGKAGGEEDKKERAKRKRRESREKSSAEKLGAEGNKRKPKKDPLEGGCILLHCKGRERPLT